MNLVGKCITGGIDPLCQPLLPLGDVRGRKHILYPPFKQTYLNKVESC